MRIKNNEIITVQSSKFSFRPNRTPELSERNIQSGDVLEVSRRLNVIEFSVNGKVIKNLCLKHLTGGREDNYQRYRIADTSNLVSYIAYESADLCDGIVTNWMKLKVNSSSYIMEQYKDVVKRNRDYLLKFLYGFDIFYK